jgi:ribosome modulation factor
MKIELNPEAYNAGFAAGEAGEFSNACPHRPASIESLSWHSGFIEGKAKRLAILAAPRP